MEYYGENLNHWSKVVILDLCPSLCATAKKRVQNHEGWNDIVDVVCGDACDFECEGLPAAGTVDVVTFSYALSMIPDWKKAIENASRLLKPGGHIAVCDFTVLPDKQWRAMGTFWTWVFAHDHVHLKEEHATVLKEIFESIDYQDGFGGFPYVPFTLQCPWYSFVGRKNKSASKIQTNS